MTWFGHRHDTAPSGTSNPAGLGRRQGWQSGHHRILTGQARGPRRINPHGAWPGAATATAAARLDSGSTPGGMSGCSRRSPLDSCSWTPRGGSGSGPLARRGTATLVMANCTSRLAKVPRSRPLSRDRTRCPRCPASRGTTRCRHRQPVVVRGPRRARPVVRIRPQVRPGALHPRARCRPARQDAADS